MMNVYSRGMGDSGPAAQVGSKRSRGRSGQYAQGGEDAKKQKMAGTDAIKAEGGSVAQEESGAPEESGPPEEGGAPEESGPPEEGGAPEESGGQEGEQKATTMLHFTQA
jgi:hypothetical protein